MPGEQLGGPGLGYPGPPQQRGIRETSMEGIEETGESSMRDVAVQMVQAL
jgi:hypothetical protein